jgi:hypothetical protein
MILPRDPYRMVFCLTFTKKESKGTYSTASSDEVELSSLELLSDEFTSK